MKQILEWIWNAQWWQILAILSAFVGLLSAAVCGLTLHINRIRAKAMSEFEQRRKEMRERMDRGARRTG
jgi:hypothetical protein